MYSIWNAPSDRDYYDPQGLWEARETEDDDRCFDCGAADDEACMEQCTTQRLATHDDLEERDDAPDNDDSFRAEDPYASDPDDLEELNRNEADDYLHEGDDACDEPGLELAEEWA